MVESNNACEMKFTVFEMAAALLVLLAPLNPVMATIVLLIVIDFITGLYAAYRTKTRIRSKRMSNTISKFLFYNMVIIAGYFIEVNIVQEIPFTKIVAGFIAMTEFKSIGENFNKIYGINFIRAIKNFFNKEKITDAILPGEQSKQENDKENQNLKS